jgi:2'-5' RNA ligase
MRLFVAIELPEALRRRLAEAIEALRSRLPRARWVRMENLHLTLAFLGETPEERLPDLERALGPVFAQRRVFSLELRKPGNFPERGRARVAWIGFEESSELRALENGVRRAREQKLGHEVEKRPFHPHLTVARCSPPWPSRAAAAWRDSALEGLGASFPVERGVLVQSRLGSGGARYSRVHSYPLEGTPCSGPA